MESSDPISNFFIESYLNDEPTGQFVDSENYLSKGKWSHVDDDGLKKYETASNDFIFKEDESTGEWNAASGKNEVYNRHDSQCEKNIWTENYVTNNRLQMKWYLNEPLKVNLKNKTVKFRWVPIKL